MTNDHELNQTNEDTSPSNESKRPRGFATMTPEKRRELASKGGKAAQAAGTGHQFTTEEARAAGRKGGTAPHIRRGRGPINPAMATSAATTATIGARREGLTRDHARAEERPQ